MSNKEVTDEVFLKQFSRVYQVTPNPNTPTGISPMELMFAKKIKSVLDKLRFGGKRKKIAIDNITIYFKIGQYVFVEAFKRGKQSWEKDKITKRIEKCAILGKGRKWAYKKHKSIKELLRVNPRE